MLRQPGSSFQVAAAPGGNTIEEQILNFQILVSKGARLPGAGLVLRPLGLADPLDRTSGRSRQQRTVDNEFRERRASLGGATSSFEASDCPCPAEGVAQLRSSTSQRPRRWPARSGQWLVCSRDCQPLKGNLPEVQLCNLPSD